MRILKRIGIVLLSIIILLAVVALFLPSKVKVERSAVINAPAETVFSQISNFKNWANWSPWDKMDPNMQKTYEGPENGVGSKYSWKSTNDRVGNGSMTISSIVQNQEIVCDLNFMENGTAKGIFELQPAENGATKVTWSMESDMGWNLPGRYFGLLMDKMVGPDFEKGLAEMKKTAESATAPDNEVTGQYNIKEVTVPTQNTLSITDKIEKTDSKAISVKFDELFKELLSYMKKNKIEPSGSPFAIYHSYNPGGTTEIEAGLPVAKQEKSSGRILAGTIHAGNAVETDYYGNYDKMDGAHKAINDYIKSHNKMMAGAPWEVYVTDPMTEKDPSKWLTQIYYPVQ